MPRGWCGAGPLGRGSPRQRLCRRSPRTAAPRRAARAGRAARRRAREGAAEDPLGTRRRSRTSATRSLADASTATRARRSSSGRIRPSDRTPSTTSSRRSAPHPAAAPARAVPRLPPGGLRYDIFCFYFDGGLLGETPFWRVELPLLRLAGKKIVVWPYGGDARLASRTRAAAGGTRTATFRAGRGGS